MKSLFKKAYYIDGLKYSTCPQDEIILVNEQIYYILCHQSNIFARIAQRPS